MAAAIATAIPLKRTIRYGCFSAKAFVKVSYIPFFILRSPLQNPFVRMRNWHFNLSLIPVECNESHFHHAADLHDAIPIAQFFRAI